MAERRAGAGGGPAGGSALAERVKAVARALGFDRAGIAPLGPTPESRALGDWLDRGRHGEMAYLARRREERIDPARVMEGARSALVVALVYDREEDGPVTAAAEPRGRVARYAGGEDYHDVMLARLRSVGDALEAAAGRPVRSRAYVDTGPLLERVLGAYAGLGWIGKNTCLIEPALGSYFFLGVLLTDLDLPPDRREPDHCGSCRACLDACPTAAFPEPYVMDARRCLAYTTIELRGEIPEPLRADQGDWVFGCDVCQEVCPWNSRRGRRIPPDPAGLRARLAPAAQWRRPALGWLLDLREEDWRAATRRTALRRAKYRGLLRNALVAAGNARDPALRDRIARHVDSDDPVIADCARWALERLEVG